MIEKKLHVKEAMGIMQPYFFPYIGYFQLINLVDKFVVYDDVNFIKKGWINRNNVLVNGQASMFTVPLIGASQNKLINEVEMENLETWSKKFLKTIEQSYKKAPFYESTLAILKAVFEKEYQNIAELATASLKETCAYVGIKTEIIEHSSIYNNKELKAQQRILDICLQEKAEHYINPIGGQEIYDKSLFADNGILLNFIKSNKVSYKQFSGEFVPWLSMIDVLMFCSVEQIQQMLNEYELV